MLIELLLLSCCVLGSIFKWDADSSGLWSEGSNWDQGDTPSISSSVVLPARSDVLTVIVDDHVTVASLKLSAKVLLLFKDDSTLTITDTLLLNGGTFHTDPSSTSSSTSVNTLVLKSGYTLLTSHKLIVNGYFDIPEGALELDELSVLEFVNVNNITIEKSDLFLHYTWNSSLNTIDQTGIHNSDAIEIQGPLWKQDEVGGYLDITPGNTLHIPNIPGVAGWRSASISLWVYWEEGGMGFGWAQSPCRFHFRRSTLGWVGSSGTFSVPYQQWFHLVIVTTNSQARVYVNGVHRWTVSPSSSSWFRCPNGPQTFFPLSEISNSGGYKFRGRIRAVQIFRKSLTISEIGDLDYKMTSPAIGVFGNGKLSLVNSEVQLVSSKFEFKTISLRSSTLQSNDVILDNTKTLELLESLVIFSQNSKLLSDDLSISLSSSELYFDDSVEVIVGALLCSHCQVLGNTLLSIDSYLEVDSGNFSSPLIVLESAKNSLITGTVQFDNTVDLLSHVILDDVAVSASSLTLSSNAVLLFKRNSTLTVTGTLLLNGGTFHTDLSSTSSFTSVDSLVLDAELVSLFSHKLIVTGLFDWKRGSMDLVNFSELVLENVTFTSFNDGESPLSSDVLHVWGNNNYRLLGVGLSGHQWSPESFNLPFPTRQASVGRSHSLVLLTNGDVYTSGRNNYGQLGYADGDRSRHEKIEISNIIQVVASYHSSYALGSTGYVYSWGLNNNGQLGLGHTNNTDTPNSIPKLSNVKQVAGRLYTAFALTRDGKVYGWGSGGNNILCRASTASVHSPMVINSLQNIKFIAAGQASFFIKEDGSTLTCGRNLGGSGTYPTPTPFAEDIEFTFIDTINLHALGIAVNQNLWSWGSGSNGRLGRGSTTASNIPVRVNTIGKVINAAAGETHSTAVDVYNDVWSWGNSNDGALGRDTSSNDERWSPGRITHLDGKGVTGISACYRSNFAYIYVPPPTMDLITSSSNEGFITLEENSLIAANLNEHELRHVNLISLPVFLSGLLSLTSDSFFFSSQFNLNGFLSIDSPRETYIHSLFFGASECSALSLESNVFVETLYWYSGTIEGVGEMKVNTLVLCSSNPEPEFFNRISIGKMMTSDLNVELNLTTDLVLSVNGVIEVPQLSFYSDLDVSVAFYGDVKLVNTLVSLHSVSHLNSIIEIDQNSRIEVFSTSLNINYDYDSSMLSQSPLPPSITGLGSIELNNSDITFSDYSSIKFEHLVLDSSVLHLNNYAYLSNPVVFVRNLSELILLAVSATTYFDHSHIYLDNSTIIHSAIELNLYNLTLTNTVFEVPSVTEKLSIHALFLDLNSATHVSSAFSVNQLHWIDGELSYSDVLDLKNLFLYGKSKTWPENYLKIENELRFNNSLTFSISQLNLITVSVTCFYNSELVLDSPFFDESLLEVKNHLHLTSNCSLSSLLPVDSTGIIFVGNDSVLTLFKHLSTSSGIFILPKGELVIMNSIITFEESVPYSHPDLFLYYNWVTSSNRVDITGRHDPTEIVIHGPEWKFDDTGGYFDITPGDTLHIPNIPGIYGWRGASISVWMYINEGGIGFCWGQSPCRAYFTTGLVGWGSSTGSVSITRNRWCHLVMTYSWTHARIYIDGTQIRVMNPDHPFYDSNPPSFFPLSSVTRSNSHDFRGRIRAVQVFTKSLSTSEISQLSFDKPVGIWGQGKLSIVDSEMSASATFRVQQLYLVSSTVYLDSESLTSELKLIEIDSKLIIDSIYLKNTSSIVTNASLVVSNFHWFAGELFSPEILTLKGLFLYGESKTWHHDSLVIQEAFYFNNSLTFSISHLTLITVSTTCLIDSELILGSPSFYESLLEVKNQLYLNSQCNLTAQLPVQSTGIIAVGNDSVMTFEKELKSFSLLFVSYRGELLLSNSHHTFIDVMTYNLDDLFLYYNWMHSFNQFDFSGSHNLNAIIIDGPEWKTDDIAGYLDVKPDDTLHIPNIPGEYGWRYTSISFWMYFEEGGMGFGWNTSPCRFHIRTSDVRWGNNGRNIQFPLHKWFHLVITFDQSRAHIYVDGDYQGSVTPSTPYRCTNDPPSYFHLSGIEGSSNRFKGRIRAVQIFRKTLTVSEVTELNFDVPQGIWGQGHISLIDSNVEFIASQFYIRSISLISSSLQSRNVIFDSLKQVDLHSESIMSLSEDSEIISHFLSITLNSSELYYDDSVDISSSTVSLIAINSRFQNDLDFADFHILDLSFSTFQSVSDTQVVVGYFSCFHCQVLGKSVLLIETYSEINSGNFSTSLIVQESVDNSSISGQVQLANSFDFFSHVILDDVSVSEFQSSSGSITCHSDVLMRNFVTLSTTSFDSDADIILSDANVILEQKLELSVFQILKGSGTVFNNTSNAGKLIPLPLIIFDDSLALLPSSIVSIQINSGDSFTQLIIGSTAYLDGILEIEFETMYDSTGNNYTIIESDLINGKFHDVISPCNSLITTIYSETSLIVSVNDNVLDLNQTSYISTTGIDDPCCGTFDSPCASFRGVLDRMGSKGKVYFHEGSYTFNQGLGNVTDVDWQLIGLGDVIIEGIDETLFEIVHSNLSLSNIDIFVIPPIVFLYMTQPFN
ncbi:hypothetical protein GEMRC1_009047 [Eukaryota sp. GEM-RC1]